MARDCIVQRGAGRGKLAAVFRARVVPVEIVAAGGVGLRCETRKGAARNLEAASVQLASVELDLPAAAETSALPCRLSRTTMARGHPIHLEKDVCCGSSCKTVASLLHRFAERMRAPNRMNACGAGAAKIRLMRDRRSQGRVVWSQLEGKTR